MRIVRYWFWLALLALMLVGGAHVRAQDSSGSPAGLGGLDSLGRGALGTQGISPDQLRGLEETFKSRPELRQEFLRQKESLGLKEGKTETKEGEKKEGEKKEGEKKTGIEQKTPQEQERILKTFKETQEPTFFERYRPKGKYQDISTTLKPFGFDFFKDAENKITSERKDLPVPPSYVVGPGDEVKILLWGRMNNELRLSIDRNGNITIPQIGPVYVAGMTFEAMAKHLLKLSEQIVGTKIDITMGSLKSIPIFVLGEVQKPGSYTVGSFSTITDALLTAGGPSNIGSMRDIQLKRDGKVIGRFDLYDLLLKGDKSKDVTLLAGDVVFCPVTGPVVGIAGNVRRPAIYELKDKRDLGSLLELAGGIIPTAYMQQIQIERVVKNEKQVIIDIDDRNLRKSKAFELHDTDLVKVFNIVGREENVVFLQGNVKRPGKYEYRPGMTIRDVIKDEKDCLPETYLEYAMISRTEPPAFEAKTIPVNLKALFENRQYNIELHDQDNIVVFSKWFFGDKPFVMVEGEVRGARARIEIDPRVLDDLRKAGITRLDDPRLTEVGPGRPGTEQRQNPDETTPQAGASRPIVDQKTIDELRLAGITSLDDPRLTSLRGQTWPGARELDQKEIDELRDDSHVSGRKDPTSPDKPVIDERVIEELKKAGITRLDDPRLVDPGDKGAGASGLSRIIMDSKTLDELRRAGITKLDDPKIAEMKVQGRTDQRKFVRIPLSANMTVRDAILAAGGLSADAYRKEAELYRINPADRTVSLVRFSPEKAMLGDIKENMALKMADRIVVHSIRGFNYKKTVSIDGEVLRPGSYAYAENMKVKDLIFAAGNILEGAYLDQAEITTQLVESDKYVRLEHRNISLKKALEGDPSANVTLNPYDRLTVKRLQDWRKERFATVSGEVLFPGKYVTKKGERLSSLIERAGGYGDEAYLRGAVFTRARVKDLQQKTLDEMAARMERELLAAASTTGALSADEARARDSELLQRQKFIETLKKTEPSGRMTIYLANLRLMKGTEYDLQLDEGDTLYIPTKNAVVSVAGAVMAGGTFVHSDSMEWKDYVQMAGGYTRYADTSNVFVIKVDGSARKVSSSMISWNPFKNRWEMGDAGEPKSDIEAGDSIIVPERLDRTAWLRQIRDIAQIFGNIGLTAATVAVLYKTMKNN